MDNNQFQFNQNFSHNVPCGSSDCAICHTSTNGICHANLNYLFWPYWNQICPTCGKCPTCGNLQIPNKYSTSPNPWTITSGGTAI